MKPGDLVRWKQGTLPDTMSASTSTYLILQRDSVRTNLTGEGPWRALSCQGNLVVVHEDTMEVINETE